jgi:hypothetical protein
MIVRANSSRSAWLGSTGYDMASMCRYAHKGGPNAHVWIDLRDDLDGVSLVDLVDLVNLVNLLLADLDGRRVDFSIMLATR